ncbi:RNA methyltransferase [Sulfodiicoccus acidiphilus]|uniref:RNA methyltransferase n=1 Tax=Sulfodiicoccus acidiphilus TaxID=1670455 RepID=A0A348B0V6_9CREN|nr:tRNA (cytidine-2'-O-)-methyltransferase TrmJ [Sulfodiicoccus acidiphilus]BBD71808.1 RNA methyltransferase [Sulfodiicoccus acidiphilus]GGT99317.1 RNA methyltransferase [Sulfodiicoccus acidiphilus]
MIRVVLVEPEGEYNVGFVARLCRNFDVEQLYIVNPRCDLRSALNFAAHGKEALLKAQVVDTLSQALEGVDLKMATSSDADNPGDILRLSIPPWTAAEVGRGKRTALIFGRESVGLTREEISMADFLLHIPASKEYPVLNLSHAVSILLYEFRREANRDQRNVNAESLSLLDKYVRLLYEQVKGRSVDERAYIVTKRVIFRGVRTEAEARTLMRLMRKLYLKLEGVWR